MGYLVGEGSVRATEDSSQPEICEFQLSRFCDEEIVGLHVSGNKGGNTSATQPFCLPAYLPFSHPAFLPSCLFAFLPPCCFAFLHFCVPAFPPSYIVAFLLSCHSALFPDHYERPCGQKWSPPVQHPLGVAESEALEGHLKVRFDVC